MQREIRKVRTISIVNQPTLTQYLNKYKPKKQQNSQTNNLDKIESKKLTINIQNKKQEQQYVYLDSDSDISAQIEEVKIDQIKKEETINQSKQINYLFYQNQIKSNPRGDYIDVIHSTWNGNYALLERHHGYVQWLFPNHYLSRFNNESQSLSESEAKHFKTEIEIANRLVKSYEMFLDFLGIQIDLNKGTFTQSKNYKERYQQTLITSWHNHMRMTRLLAHFNITGFRLYAINLVNFLEKEIYGDQPFIYQIEGAIKTRNQSKPYDSTAPLHSLVQCNVFDEWRQYGKCCNKRDYDNLQKKCFTSYDNIKEQSIFFTNN